MNVTEFVDSVLPCTLGNKNWYESIYSSDDFFGILCNTFIVVICLFMIIFVESIYSDIQPGNKFLFRALFFIMCLVWFLKLLILFYRHSFFVCVKKNEICIEYHFFLFHYSFCIRTDQIKKVDIQTIPNNILCKLIFGEVKFFKLICHNSDNKSKRIVQFPLQLIEKDIDVMDHILFGIILNEITEADISVYEENMFGENPDVVYQDYLKNSAENHEQNCNIS